MTTQLARYRVATDAPLPNAPPGDLRREYFAEHIPATEQYRPYFGSTLDMQRIEAAIIAANFGRMHLLTDLARETIHLDGHVNALLQKRLNRLGALDWQLTPASGPGIDETRAKERCEEVRENLAMIPNFRDRLIDIAWGNFDGRSASEIEWYRWGRAWRVRDLHWIHPRRLCFGPDRDLRVQDPMRQTGNFQDVGTAIEWIPFKFLTFKPRMFGDYQEREGLAPRTLYWSFFARIGRRAQLALMEIFGAPWRIMVPKQGTPGAMPMGAGNVDLYESSFQALCNLGYQNTARMPPGVEVQIVQPEAGAGQVHNDVITDCRQVLTKLYLGGVATTDAVSTGLGSTIGNVHLSEEDLIIASDARRIAEAVEDRLTDAIVVVNYGPAEAAYAPKFAIRTDPPVDRTDELTRLKLALDVGLRVAEEEARERSGYRAVRADEPYIVRFQRPSESGQLAPPPAPETVWPANEAPPAGEIPAAPDVSIALPAAGAAPALLPPGAGGRLPPPDGGAPGDVAVPALPVPKSPGELPGGGAPGAPGDPGHKQQPGADGQALSDDAPIDEDVARLAQRMTELGIARCEHEKVNRCRICGIERVRGNVELGDDGKPVWAVAWKPIGSVSTRPAAPPANDADPLLEDDDASMAGIDASGDAGNTGDNPGGDGDGDPDPDEDAATRTARETLHALRLAVSFGGPPSEGGNHWHSLDREQHATAIDGAHTHWYQLPDGSLVESVEGGRHQHRFPDDERTYIFGGQHRHTVEIDGGFYPTQVDGSHAHELQSTATTQSGAHSHCLVLPDGATIEALSSAELGELLEDVSRGLEPVSYRQRLGRRLSGIVLESELAEVVALGRSRKAPRTAFGSPDDLVERGTSAFATEALALGRAIVERIGEKKTGKAIKSAIDAAARAWKRERFVDAIAPELEHGQWLGALDAHYEAESGRAVKVESFTGMWEGILLLKGDDPGAALDPAFARRPQKEAGQAFIERDVVTRDVFDQMSTAAQRRAFTVANAATTDIARAVKRELVRQVAAGADLRDFKTAALGRLEAAGWTPLNASHAETVLRTNVMGAYNSGRYRQMSQPKVVAVRPYWQVLGIGDDRQRRTHHSIQNAVLRADDPFFRKAYPPFGFNCRCRVRSLSKAQGESIGVSSGSSYADELPDPGFASGVHSLLDVKPVISPEAAAAQVENDTTEE